MKKRIALLLAVMLAPGVLFGCGAGGSSAATEVNQEAAQVEKPDTSNVTDATDSAQDAMTAAETASETVAETAADAVPDSAADRAEPLQIVTTIFPVYDWVQNILGDKAADAEVTMLLDSGVDLHSYQPTAADLLKIAG